MTNEEIIKRFQFDLEMSRFKEAIKIRKSYTTYTPNNHNFAYGARSVAYGVNGNTHFSNDTNNSTGEIVFAIHHYSKKQHYLNLIHLLEKLDFKNMITIYPKTYFNKKFHNNVTSLYFFIDNKRKEFNTQFIVYGVANAYKESSINEIPDYVRQYKYTIFECIKDVLKCLIKKS